MDIYPSLLYFRQVCNMLICFIHSFQSFIRDSSDPQHCPDCFINIVNIHSKLRKFHINVSDSEHIYTTSTFSLPLYLNTQTHKICDQPPVVSSAFWPTKFWISRQLLLAAFGSRKCFWQWNAFSASKLSAVFRLFGGRCLSSWSRRWCI